MAWDPAFSQSLEDSANILVLVLYRAPRAADPV